MRVVVVGAGVVGSAVARSLALAGDTVTVVEAAYPGAGTSSTSFAWVNANAKEPEEYYGLNAGGLRAHHELAGDSPDGPGAPWFSPTGNIEWATDEVGEQRLRGRVERLVGRGYDVAWLTVGEALRLEPDLRVPASVRALAFFPQEGHCHPVLLLSRLLGEAVDRGATLLTRTRVTGIEPRADDVRVRLERTDGGRGETQLTADVVVSCTGRWSADLLGAERLPVLGPDRNEAATLGYLAVTAPVPTRLRRIVSTPELNVRPDGGGRLLLQGLTLDPPRTPDPVPDERSDVALELAARAARLLRGAEAARVERLHLGRRAMPADGRTACGWLEDRVYAVATHSGVTLAPLLGGLVSRELHGEVVDQLAAFRPDRFRRPGTSPEPAQPRQVGEQ